MLLVQCVLIVEEKGKTRMIIRTYSELMKLKTFEERYDYLRLSGKVGESSFGYDRYINQLFYKSPEWRRVRDLIIIRDNGCDLGIIDRPIMSKIIVHHMNPVSLEELQESSKKVFNPEFLVCTCHATHNAIHYSNPNLLSKLSEERRPGDTLLW